MPLNSPFRSARSIRWEKRYLIYKGGAQFFDYIDTREGWKRTCGKMLFRLQIPTRGGIKERNLLEEELAEPIHHFLLYDTHDYKSTAWIGVVEVGQKKRYFVKIYKKASDAADSFARSEIAMRVFSPYFILSKAQYFGGTVCAYSLLQKKRNVAIAEVEETILQRYAKELPEMSNETDSWISEQEQHNFAMAGIEIDQNILQRAGLQQMWSHGDFSHWNCFEDRSNALCLIDYEEVGLYPPLYDWFHLILKPSLLKPGCVFPEKELNRVSTRLQQSEEVVVSWMWLYLLLEMRKDLYRNRVLKSPKIDKEIHYKQILWQECQERLQQNDC